jgi:hypothetical protein
VIACRITMAGNRRLPDLARAFTDGKEESQR